MFPTVTLTNLNSRSSSFSSLAFKKVEIENPTKRNWPPSLLWRVDLRQLVIPSNLTHPMSIFK